jgi:hypothetical protein
MIMHSQVAVSAQLTAVPPIETKQVIGMSGAQTIMDLPYGGCEVCPATDSNSEEDTHWLSGPYCEFTFKRRMPACLGLIFLIALLGLSSQQVTSAPVVGELVARATASVAAEASSQEYDYSDRLSVVITAESRYAVYVDAEGMLASGDLLGSSLSLAVAGGGFWNPHTEDMPIFKWQYVRSKNFDPKQAWIRAGGRGSQYGVWGGYALVDCTGDCQFEADFGQDLLETITHFEFSTPAQPVAWNVTKTASLNPTVISMGSGSCAINFSVTLSFVPGQQSLRITSVKTPVTAGQLHSFVASDTITLQAVLIPPSEGVPVKWTVEGLQAASGMKGFPAADGRPADAQGISTFEFTPSDNEAFVRNRQTTTWTNGSLKPNPPLGFEVIARADLQGKALESRLSETGLGLLLQDEIDTLRQEYFDFRTVIPDRAIVLPSLGPGLNRGIYGVQLSVNMPDHYDGIVRAYAGSSVVVDGQSVQIPAAAACIVTTSGFRNPRRNVAAGSIYPTSSRHILGRALDLQPVAVPVLVNGRRTVLDLHRVLYPALHRAASTQGSAIAEKGADPVPVGDSREDHIHVQW